MTELFLQGAYYTHILDIHGRLLYTMVEIDEEGFPGGTSDDEPTCQHRRPKRLEFDPWVGKIPWSRKGLP